MAITFHCDKCGKKIVAKDGTGGKWGKCPSCHNKIYVPELKAPAEDDELRLAPLDEGEEEKKRRLMAETFQVGHELLTQREIPEGGNQQESAETPSDISEKDLTTHIIMYLRSMADSDLQEATHNENIIAAHSKKALPILDRIAVSDLPEPELADIPPQTLSGLIRKLRNKLGRS